MTIPVDECMGRRFAIWRNGWLDEDNTDRRPIGSTGVHGTNEGFAQHFGVTGCFRRSSSIDALDDRKGSLKTGIDNTLDQHL
jgi:hypothetical protein